MTEKAYMLISCEMGQEQSLRTKLLEFPEVKGCTVTYGSYDMVAEFEADSSEQLNRVIAFDIRRLENIRSTITLRVTIANIKGS